LLPAPTLTPGPSAKQKKVPKQVSWQFPQGGVEDGEEFSQAALREANEEMGLNPENVSAETSCSCFSIR